MASAEGIKTAPCSKHGLVVRGSSGHLGHMGLKASQENRERAIHILGLWTQHERVWQYFLGHTLKERNDLHDSFQENDISTLFPERFQGNTSLQLPVKHLNTGEGAAELKSFPTDQQRSLSAQGEAQAEAVPFPHLFYKEQGCLIQGSGLHTQNKMHESCLKVESNKAASSKIWNTWLWGGRHPDTKAPNKGLYPGNARAKVQLSTQFEMSKGSWILESSEMQWAQAEVSEQVYAPFPWGILSPSGRWLIFICLAYAHTQALHFRWSLSS